MRDVVTEVRRACDLLLGVQQERLGTLFAEADNGAHRFVIEVCRGGMPVPLFGWQVTGTFLRADETMVPLAGEVRGAWLTLSLTSACYAVPGPFTLMIRVTKGEQAATVYWATGSVVRSRTDAVVDPEHVVPELSQVLAQLAAAREAAKAASDAAAAAEAAITAMRSAGSDAGAVTAEAREAAEGAKAAAVRAEAAARQIEESIVPAFSIGEVQTLPAGQAATASITGTVKSPILNLCLPRGADGEGGVRSVNGLLPDTTGNVALPQESGLVRSVNGVMPDTSGDVAVTCGVESVNGQAGAVVTHMPFDLTVAAGEWGQEEDAEGNVVSFLCQRQLAGASASMRPVVTHCSKEQLPAPVSIWCGTNRLYLECSAVPTGSVRFAGRLEREASSPSAVTKVYPYKE